MQNWYDMRIPLIELHLNIYKKERFLKLCFWPLWWKSSRKWFKSYFSNATKVVQLIKLRCLPIVYSEVKLSLAISLVSHQSSLNKLEIIERTGLLARNRYFFHCSRCVMWKERNIRNQYLKLCQMRCGTLHFLIKKKFENLRWAPPQVIFVKK